MLGADTLEIKAGTYTEQTDRIVFPSGRDWNAPTVIRNFGSDVVRIKPSNGAAVLYFGIVPSHHIEIRGLILDSNSISGFAVAKITWEGSGPENRAHHIRFINNEFTTGGKSHNCLLNESSGVEVIGNNFHLCTYAIYQQGDSMLVEKNWFHDNQQFGLHLYTGLTYTSVDDNIVRYNLFDNNGTETALCSSAMIFSHGSNNIAYNNIIKGQGNNCDGFGIAIGNGAANTKVFNNTIYNNRGAGIYVYPGASNSIITNNIVYQNGATITDVGSGSSIYNNLTTDPKFVNAAAGDLQLQAGSAAIDSGATLNDFTNDMNGIARPQGIGWDIGAYER
jgi:parallel beta-helix repeat protein